MKTKQEQIDQLKAFIHALQEAKKVLPKEKWVCTSLFDLEQRKLITGDVHNALVHYIREVIEDAIYVTGWVYRKDPSAYNEIIATSANKLKYRKLWIDHMVADFNRFIVEIEQEIRNGQS